MMKNRVNQQREIFAQGELKMRNQENQLEYSDITLIMFVVIAGWLLLFYSGLFQ